MWDARQQMWSWCRPSHRERLSGLHIQVSLIRVLTVDMRLPSPTLCFFIRLANLLCSARDYIGFVLGLASIVTWMVAQLPQVISNIRNRSAEALSPWFLAEWLMVSNLNSIYLEPFQNCIVWNSFWPIWLCCFQFGSSTGAFSGYDSNWIAAGRYLQFDRVCFDGGSASDTSLHSCVRTTPYFAYLTLALDASTYICIHSPHKKSEYELCQYE